MLPRSKRQVLKVSARREDDEVKKPTPREVFGDSNISTK